MRMIPRKRSQVNHPLMLTIILALLNLLFPAWHIQATVKARPAHKAQRPQPEFSQVAYGLALTQSMIYGYNSVWGER